MQNNDSAPPAAPAAPTTPAPTATPKPQRAQPRPDDPIPVKRITFVHATDCLGEKNARDAIDTSDRAKVLDADGKRIIDQAAWLLDYLPRIQHVRITYYPPGKTKPEQFRFVPISALKSWDPLQ